jgi:hypothetical protein
VEWEKTKVKKAEGRRQRAEGKELLEVRLLPDFNKGTCPFWRTSGAKLPLLPMVRQMAHSCTKLSIPAKNGRDILATSLP